MPYSLVFEYKNGQRGEIKPLCCDNHKSIYGYEDRSIERKAKKLASQINKRFNDVECSVLHYEA